MTVILEVVLPVFALILAGYGAGRLGLIKPEGFAGLATFVFCLAAPALLFLGGTRPYDGGAGPAIAQVGAAVLMYGVAILIARRWFAAQPAEAAVFGLTCIFGNSVMMGIPLIVAAYGVAGVAPMIGILAVQTITLLGLATILTEVGLQADAPRWQLFRNATRGILRNPIVLSVVAALIWRGLGLPIPDVARRTLELLGAAAPPAALFCLGGGLLGLGAAGLWRETAVVCLIKLLALPGLTFLLASLLGLSPVETAVAVTIGALPTGANAFILARRYQTGADRSGAAVVVTTALSVLTLSVLIGYFRETIE